MIDAKIGGFHPVKLLIASTIFLALLLDTILGGLVVLSILKTLEPTQNQSSLFYLAVILGLLTVAILWFVLIDFIDRNLLFFNVFLFVLSSISLGLLYLSSIFISYLFFWIGVFFGSIAIYMSFCTTILVIKRYNLTNNIHEVFARGYFIALLIAGMVSFSTRFIEPFQLDLLIVEILFVLFYLIYLTFLWQLINKNSRTLIEYRNLMFTLHGFEEEENFQYKYIFTVAVVFALSGIIHFSMTNINISSFELRGVAYFVSMITLALGLFIADRLGNWILLFSSILFTIISIFGLFSSENLLFVSMEIVGYYLLLAFTFSTFGQKLSFKQFKYVGFLILLVLGSNFVVPYLFTVMGIDENTLLIVAISLAVLSLALTFSLIITSPNPPFMYQISYTINSDTKDEKTRYRINIQEQKFKESELDKFFAKLTSTMKANEIRLVDLENGLKAILYNSGMTTSTTLTQKISQNQIDLTKRIFSEIDNYDLSKKPEGYQRESYSIDDMDEIQKIVASKIMDEEFSSGPKFII